MNADHEIVLSRAEARAIDEAAVSELGMSGLLLMENAARGVVEVLLQEFPDLMNRHSTNLTIGRVTIICGPGNNGGDGLVVARQLAARDVLADVQLLRADKTLTGDAQFNLNILVASGIEVTELAGVANLLKFLSVAKPSDVIVDCLLGTGVRGAVRAPYLEVIEAINASAARVVAVDVPSGFDCDLGPPSGACICADRTVTFVGRKRGFDIPESERCTGIVSVAQIGLPLNWIRHWLSRFRSF